MGRNELVLLAALGAGLFGAGTARAADIPPSLESEPPERVAVVPEPPAPGIPGWRVGGAIGIWARGFVQRPQFEGQRGVALWPNIEGWIKADYSWNNNNDRITVRPYGRFDFYGSRSVFDIREGYYLHVGNGWDVLVGVNTVRWGVTESRHLVNIINQIDFGWSIDGDELLGQPMTNVNFATPLGTLSLYGLYGFRPFHQAKLEDRLRFAFPADGSTVLASNVEKNVNFAARLSNTFPVMTGSVDAGLSYFHGISREPRYSSSQFGLNLPMVAIYDKIDQAGLDAVGTFGQLQLKFEGIGRSQLGQQYAATVAGFEYTFSNVAGTGADVGLVAEHLTDDRSALQPPTVYTRAVFVGGRLTLNDSSNTHFLAGYLHNYRDGASYAEAKFRTRVKDDLDLALEGRYFITAPQSDVLFTLLHDSHVQMRLTQFF
jgi:hypothetical protein